MELQAQQLSAMDLNAVGPTDLAAGAVVEGAAPLAMLSPSSRRGVDEPRADAPDEAP